MAAQIRIAREEDAREMLAIYAPVVKETAISFELEPPTEGEFGRRIVDTLERIPWLVCDLGNDVVGYAYAGPYRSRGRTSGRWRCRCTCMNATGDGESRGDSTPPCWRVYAFRDT